MTAYYDFLFREYSQVEGRWLSPDPAGLAVVNPEDPPSWNRYAYVGNMPLNFVEPLGLAPPRSPENCNPKRGFCVDPQGPHAANNGQPQTPTKLSCAGQA